MNYWDFKTYADFLDFVEPNMVSEKKEGGILNITIRNWKLLDPLLYTMIDMSQAIFRGVVSNTFDLKPSIFRLWAFNDKKRIKEKNDYIDRCYNHFVEAMRGRRDSLSKPLESYNKIELWSLGRHFGVKNTLLDWSHSPYICLFFAFSNWADEGTRSLYCLKRNIIEEVQKACFGIQQQKEITLNEEPNLESLLFYKPISDDNFRMINQQGLFTVSRSPHTIEEWVLYNYKIIQEKFPKKTIAGDWILMKIDIETTTQDERKDILKKLNRMNINYCSLFPDIEGAALYANMQGDIHHY